MENEKVSDILFDHNERITRNESNIKTLFCQQKAIEKLSESTHQIAQSVEKLVQRVDGIEETAEKTNIKKFDIAKIVISICGSFIVGWLLAKF